MKLGQLTKTICGSALALMVRVSSANAASTLVFGDFSSSRNVLAAELAVQGNTVTNQTSLPGDLSAFDTIWHVGAGTPLSLGVQNQLSGFLADGKGIYLTGERPCCEALNATLGNLINTNLASGSVVVGGQGDFFSGPFNFNTNALGNIGSVISSWAPNAPGGIVGPTGDNVLVSHGPSSTVVGAAWDDPDLINGGRIVLFMDVNWLSALDTNEKNVILATQEFLFDGFVGQRPSEVPLPAAGWMMLAGLGGLGAVVRRKKQSIL